MAPIINVESNGKTVFLMRKFQQHTKKNLNVNTTFERSEQMPNVFQNTECDVSKWCVDDCNWGSVLDVATLHVLQKCLSNSHMHTMDNKHTVTWNAMLYAMLVHNYSDSNRAAIEHT